MRIFSRMCVMGVVSAVFLCFSMCFAGDKKEYPASPPAKLAKKWRVGYIEGGPYKDYQQVFVAVINGLAELGWMEKTELPTPKDEEDTKELWAWLAEHGKSGYLEFVADAYYSNRWNSKLREETKKTLLKRLNGKKDMDLMLVLGTWAGQDLANNEHSVPTAICSVSDALTSKIVKSLDDSGYDHVHARLDPARYERQIRAFHDIISFRKLGVPFENTEVGRSYAAMGDIKKVAKERGFEIIPCHLKEHDMSKEESEADLIRCAGELAPKVDAFYLTSSNGVSDKSLPKIVESLVAHKVPSFSQSALGDVRKGIMLSVATPDFAGTGRFHAEAIGKIINGAKPRELDMIYESPVRIAFNKAAARAIDLRNDVYQLLSETADEVHDEIE